MKFQIKTLGCKVNQSESEELASELAKSGLIMVTEGSEADLVIINTCTVTAAADSKARQMISRAIKDSNGKVIVTGCAVNNPNSGLNKFSNNIQFIKKEEIHKLKTVVGASQASSQRQCNNPSIRSRPLLKIQDGCDHSCSYCIVPIVRGPAMSIPVPIIKERAKQILSLGYKEIVLTGVDIGAYDNSGQNLESLLRDLLNFKYDFRIRLSSIEPQSINERFISFISGEKRICAHLHLPLQSGSERILKLMRRPYSKAYFKKLTRKIRTARKNIALTTDIIVGFPSETSEDFLETKSFVEEIGFSKVHIFRYSQRPGVKAASIREPVDENVKKKRAAQLNLAANKISEKIKKSHIGKTAEVLIEGKADKYYKGVTSNYLTVYLSSKDEANISKGQFAKAKISEFNEGRLFGKLLTSD